MPAASTIIFPSTGTAKFRGLLSPVLQSQEWEYDPTSGYTFNQVYFGWDFAAMTRYANYYNAYGIGTRLKLENGKASLYTRDATLASLIDRWEIQVDQTQPSMFENELFNELMNLATDKTGAMTLLRSVLGSADPSNATTTWGALLNGTVQGYNSQGALSNFLSMLGTAFPNPSSNLTLLQEYFTTYTLGVTNFISGRYVLRHTTNAPNRWQSNIADFNVERIYTIAQLLSECQNSGLWIFPLPGYLAYKIANYYIPNLIGPSYVWGALKQRSSATTMATSRVEIVTEYIIDQISTLLYRQL